MAAQISAHRACLRRPGQVLLPRHRSALASGPGFAAVAVRRGRGTASASRATRP